MIQFFQIAGVPITLEYDTADSPFSVIAEKMALVACPEQQSPAIRFRWGDGAAAMPKTFTRLAKVTVGDNAMSMPMHTDWKVAMIRDPETGTLTVHIAEKPLSLLKKIRFSRKKCLKYSLLYGITFQESRAKKIMYNVMEPIMLAELSRRGKTLIHASCVVDDRGRALLFPAWSGVGKTSLMSWFLSNGFRHLCDDITVLSADGTVSYYPLPMNLFGFHKSICPDMHARLLRSMSRSDRLRWNLFGHLVRPNRITRWVSAETLYGRDKLALNGKLSGVFHMQRDSDDHPLLARNSTPEAVARYTTNTIVNEMSELVLLTSYCNALSGNACFADLKSMLSQISEIARQGFATTSVHELILGIKTTPEEVFGYLRKTLPDML